MIDGVVGVIIWTDTLTVMRAFYSDILGLELHSEHDNFIFYKWGDMRLGIGIHSKVKGKAVDPYRLMINLGVQDIFQEYTSLVEKGVNFLRPPEQEKWGGWVCTFRDPDLNIIQLIQQPKV